VQLEDRPWDRLPGEGTRAHAAFAAYRDLGADRSLAKVARTLGKSTGLLERWSRVHHWVSRCRDFDAAVAERRLQAQLKAIEEMRGRQIAMSLLGQQKGMEALALIDPSTLKPNEAKDYLIAFMVQERILRGQPETIVKNNQAGADGEKLPAPVAQQPTIVIQEVVVRTREEVEAAVEDAKAQGIPLLAGGD
jgi:hypothetical protein